MKRTICIITGSRADYGIYYSLMHGIKLSSNLKLQIIATGMHLMKEFGYTANEIEKDGFSISIKVDINYKKDTGLAMAISIGEAVSKFAASINWLRPDIILILGDRGEMLAAAIAANYLNIPVAHIHGGELSGHIDGIFRHAIAKLSHLHFPATLKSYRRILKLGEESWRVHEVGSPAIDRISATKIKSLDKLKKYLPYSNKPYFLIVQHPVLGEENIAADQIKTTLDAAKEIGYQTIVIYPNADAGGRRMINVIKDYCDKSTLFRSFKSIPPKDYLSLLKYCFALLGNSSSGIIEAPSFKIPVINIGTRQNGREKSTNVIDVDYDKREITQAIKRTLNDKKFILEVNNCQNLYGDGHASERIVKILSSVKLDSKLQHKKITY